MARITVEDCLKKIDSQYDLVLLAKERTSQLNAGEKSLVPEDNDKNTVISLREIGDGKVSIKTLEDSAINKLRKQQEETVTLDGIEDDEKEDSFYQKGLPLVGKTPVMQNLYQLVAKLIYSDLPIMIYGESGTGKTLIAKVLHNFSDRRTLPLVTVSEVDLNEFPTRLT